MCGGPGDQGCGCGVVCDIPETPVFTLTVQYDLLPSQTSWLLKDLTLKKKVAAMSRRKSRRFPPNHQYVKSGLNFIPGHKYLLLMKDRNGFRTGYISITATIGGGVVWEKKYMGRFRRIAKKRFVLDM